MPETRFHGNVFTTLLEAASEAANLLQKSEILSEEWQCAMKLQLAIERAMK